MTSSIIMRYTKVRIYDLHGILPLSKLLFLAFIINFQAHLYAQKNDTVYLNNGDRISGELKRFEDGKLVLSTDGMSTINIEYEKIKTIYSAKYYEIDLNSGFNYFGYILKSDSALHINLAISNDTSELAIDKIVKITPIKNKFWKKFYGSVNLGFSYYSSTDILQYYFNTDIYYRSRKSEVNFYLSTLSNNFITSDSTEINKKNDISLTLNRFYAGKWWAALGVKGQQNSELDLDLRLQAGLATGYDIVYSNSVRLYSMAGLLVNSERSVDSTNSTTNYEGVLSTKFTIRKNVHPKLNFSTSINAYPSFTVDKRWRIDFDLSLNYEIIDDLNATLTVYDNYDNKPMAGGSALNDFGTMFSIGYTF